MASDKAIPINATSSSSNITTLQAQLPKEKFWDHDLYKWEGFWYLQSYLKGAVTFRSHFESSDTDVIVASALKTGTTWMKALIVSIMSCYRGDAYVFDDGEDPLITNHTHSLIRTLETHIYIENPTPDLSNVPSPRMFDTHMPYQGLPESIKNSNCKMVYVVWNPKDTFISLWHFLNATWAPEQSQFPIEKSFESFCNGVNPSGPFLDHVLEYWKESLVI